VLSFQLLSSELERVVSVILYIGS